MRHQYNLPDHDRITFSFTCDLLPTAVPYPEHFHDLYEISYIVRGMGKYIVEGVQYPIRPGALMLFCPRVFHYIELQAGEPYERYIIHFRPSALTEETKYLHGLFVERQERGTGNYYAAEDLPPDIPQLISRFEPNFLLEEKEIGILLQHRLSELLLLLSQAKTAPGLQADNSLGARVLSYLNENLHTKISLDELARIFFVSKYHLCRTFKEHTGVSIHGYITQKRLILAKQLIDGGETAANAAYQVGFGDYSAFFRAYKKLIGRAPSEK